MILISTLLTQISLPIQAVDYYLSGKQAGKVTSNYPILTAYPNGRENMTQYSAAGYHNAIIWNIGGQTVFCLEPNLQAYRDQKYTPLSGDAATVKLKEPYSTLSYTDAQILQMAKINTVGYGWNGDTSNEMYQATQFMLWEVKFPGSLSNYPAGVPEKINEIKQRLKMYDLPVSFANQPIEFTRTGDAGAVTLKDTNEVLQYYQITSASEGLKGTLNGNSLTLSLDENAPASGEITFATVMKNDNKQTNVYYSRTSQTVGTFENVPGPSFTLRYQMADTTDLQPISANKKKTVNREIPVSLTKEDETSSKPIEGAQFDVYVNDKKLDTITTDAKGQASYTYRSSKEIVSETYSTKYVANFNELPPVFQQQVIANGYYTSKADAQKYLDDKIAEDLSAKEKAYMDEKVTVKLVEVKSGANYYLDPAKAEQTSEAKAPAGVSFIFKNQAITGKIQIEKTGESLIGFNPSTKEDKLIYTDFEYGKAPLKDAEFTLYANEDIYKADGTLAYKKSQEVGKLKTDEKGLASMDNLPLGSYILKETFAPAGFVLDTKEHKVVLDAKNAEKGIVSSIVPNLNKRTKLEIELNKISNFETKLEGAKFGLYNENEILVKDKKLKANTLIEESISDKDGKVTFNSDLPLGKYYLKELEAPKGYLLNEEKIEIDGTAGNEAPLVKRIEKEAVNTFADVEFTVIKTDSKTQKPVVNLGGKFALYEKELFESPLQENTVDETGKVKFTINKPGEYEIKELEAPKGYTISLKNIELLVKEDGSIEVKGEETNETEYENDRIPEEIKDVPGVSVMTSTRSGLLTSISALILSLAALIYFAVVHFVKK